MRGAGGRRWGTRVGGWAEVVTGAWSRAPAADLLLAKGGAVNLLRDAHVIERAELALIIDVDVLLVARGRVRDVELEVPEWVENELVGRRGW